MTNTTGKSLVEIARTLRAQSETLAEQTAELERKVRAARGTRDLKRPARGSTPPATEYHVGDEGPTAGDGGLMDVVARMLRERPMTLQALIDETGARANRLKGVVWRLQKNDHKVVNLGTDTKAIWFLPDDQAAARITRFLKKR